MRLLQNVGYFLGIAGATVCLASPAFSQTARSGAPLSTPAGTTVFPDGTIIPTNLLPANNRANPVGNGNLPSASPLGSPIPFPGGAIAPGTTVAPTGTNLAAPNLGVPSNALGTTGVGATGNGANTLSNPGFVRTSPGSNTLVNPGFGTTGTSNTLGVPNGATNLGSPNNLGGTRAFPNTTGSFSNTTFPNTAPAINNVPSAAPVGSPIPYPFSPPSPGAGIVPAGAAIPNR